MPRKKLPIPPAVRHLVAILVIAAGLASAAFFTGELDKITGAAPLELPISEVLTRAGAGQVTAVRVEDSLLRVDFADGSRAIARKEPNASAIGLGLDLDPTKVKITVADTSGKDFWRNLFFDFLPILLLIGLTVWLFRRMAGGGGPLGMGKISGSDDAEARARRPKTTFADVAGTDEAKDELRDIVDFLKNPKKYHKMGARIPRGVLLFGPPGTGKTLLARAVAGEAKSAFFATSGSEFEEMFVGVGASRARDLFKKARDSQPAIIFIDEIDAIGKQRGGNPMGGQGADQTLNQILVEMDGFDPRTSVIVMAATNRVDVLDPALLRPGRFDRHVALDLPNAREREEILGVHARGKPLARGISMKKIAAGTAGMSGADLANALNEAAILAAKSRKKTISAEMIERAIERVVLGSEKKSRVLTEEEKKITAYHEAGHALVAHALPHADPVEKISIVSRGRALGVTWFRPEEEKHLRSAATMRDELAAMLGGFAAEKLLFGQTTTGPSNDLARATAIAEAMIADLGMGEFGPVVWKTSGPFADPRAPGRLPSEATARALDEAVEKLLAESVARATEILKSRREILDAIAEVLLKKEILSRDEFEKIAGEKEKSAPAAAKKSARARK